MDGLFSREMAALVLPADTSVYPLAFIFTASISPFIFIALDAVVRGVLGFSLDDLGSDMALAGSSLSAARIIELIDSMASMELSITQSDHTASALLIFSLILAFSLMIWFLCIAIVDREVGATWPIIGGEDLPMILSILLGLSASVFLTAAYAISRVII